MIDVRQLRYFVEVATLGSIKRAAERLHIAQPALSRRMALLEHELGAALFDRSASGVTLTAAGRRLLGRAASLADEIGRLRERLHTDVDQPTQLLHLGAIPSPSLMLLTRLVAEYHRIEPDVVLQVVEAPSPILRELLFADRLDIALLTDPTVDDRIASRPLWRERLFLVTPAGRDSTATGLAGLPFVLPTRDPRIADLIERALRRIGLPFHFDLEIASAASVKHLIGTGSAYSVLPYSAVTDVPPDTRLALRRVPDLWIRRSIAWRYATPPRREAARLIVTIERLVEERCAADPNGDFRREQAAPLRTRPRGVRGLRR